MKRACVLVLAMLLALLTGCLGAYENVAARRERMLKLFDDNRETVVASARTGDFHAVLELPDIEIIDQRNGIIEYGWGLGFASACTYYGFFYSPTDNLIAWNGGACPLDELAPSGPGYLWQQTNGDNTYYVEPLAEHFFFYEADF